MNFKSLFVKTPQRKVPLINNISVLLICLILVTYTYPGFIQTGHSDWRDPVAIGLGIIGGGLAIGGAIATAPAWGVAGGVCAIVGGGIALWDWVDGPDEDNCDDCDGSGYYMDGTHRCPTCNPPDDDSCPDCPGLENGGGCSTCDPPPPEDNTPNCDDCTNGCSSCFSYYNSDTDYYGQPNYQ